MKIINQITDEDYIQWVEGFVKKVFKQANIKGKEMTIYGFEHSRRIYVKLDESDFSIRTWNFIPMKYDKNGLVCKEAVQYTLFLMVYNEDGSGHGEEMDEGNIKIKWENKTIEEKEK